MSTATARFNEVREHSHELKNDGEHTIEIMDPGDAWAQGDVCIVKLEGVPKGAKPLKNPSPQLAPGTTQGSRHCVRDMAGLTFYAMPNATPLDGPIIKAPCGLTVDHPEHGNVLIKQPGVYGIVYQRAFADELRRVLD